MLSVDGLFSRKQFTSLVIGGKINKTRKKTPVMINNKREDDKRLMLIALEDNHWETDVNEESSYEDIKRAFSEMIEKFESADNDTFANSRNFDIKNFDDNI